MDVFKADKIRKIIRFIGCGCALGAVITAFIFRLKPLRSFNACMASRILAIGVLVCAAALLIFDFVTKHFSTGIAAIGLAIALVGFVGNFLEAPGSSYQAFTDHVLKHVRIGASNSEVEAYSKKLKKQFEVGSYLVIFAGLGTISYNIRCMKSDD